MGCLWSDVRKEELRKLPRQAAAVMCCYLQKKLPVTLYFQLNITDLPL